MEVPKPKRAYLRSFAEEDEMSIMAILPLIFFASTYVGSFPTLPPDARGLSMGESMVAVADQSTAGFWNPAGLASQSKSGVLAMYGRLADFPVFSGVFSFSQPDEGLGAAALSWYYLGAKMYEGDVKWHESTLSYAWAKKVGYSLALGFRADFLIVGSSFESGEAKGGAFNFGLLYSPLRMLKIGMMGHDILSTLKWQTERRERLPISGDFGFSLTPYRNRILLSGEVTAEEGYYPRDLRFGVDFNVFPGIFALRGGAQRKLGEAARMQFTTGAGFTVKKYSWTYVLDYGILFDSDVLGTLHRVSLSIRW